MGADAKPRLLIIGPRGASGHEGGVEKFAEEFIRYARENTNISVLVLKKNGTEPPNVRILTVPPLRLLRTDKAAYLLYAIWHLLTGGYDRVLILGINFAMLAPLARLLGARVVVRSGSIDHKLTKWSSFMSFVFRVSESLARHAHEVVAVAPSIQMHLSQRGIDAQLIGNGIEPKTSPQINKRQGIVAVGRLTAQKNYTVLIEAAALLKENCPPVTIVGGADTSPETVKLTTLAKALELHDKMNFAGVRPRQEVLDILQQASLYVNCSHHEGMSNAVLEAIQEGAPVLLSDIDANRDLGLPDHHYFAPNDPVQLAKKLLLALQEPETYTVPQTNFDNWRTVVGRFCLALELAQPTCGAEAVTIPAPQKI